MQGDKEQVKESNVETINPNSLKGLCLVEKTNTGNKHDEMKEPLICGCMKQVCSRV